VDFDFGLFRGAKFRMGSVETLIQGGISFATPPSPDMGPPARDKDTFVLNEKADKAWLGWAPAIILNQ
jgi:paraquat-inducible protein B